jgi:hypothetical protein
MPDTMLVLLSNNGKYKQFQPEILVEADVACVVQALHMAQVHLATLLDAIIIAGYPRTCTK